MPNSDLIQIIADILTYLTSDNDTLVVKLRELVETLDIRCKSISRLSTLRKRLFLEEGDTHPIEVEIENAATRLQSLIVDEVKS